MEKFYLEGDICIPNKKKDSVYTTPLRYVEEVEFLRYLYKNSKTNLAEVRLLKLNNKEQYIYTDHRRVDAGWMQTNTVVKSGEVVIVNMDNFILKPLTESKLMDNRIFVILMAELI